MAAVVLKGRLVHTPPRCFDKCKMKRDGAANDGAASIRVLNARVLVGTAPKDAHRVMMLNSWDTKLTRQLLLVPTLDFTRTDGAVVDFFGVVRGVEDGRRIDGIEYEAFEPMAQRLLAEIAQETVERHGVSHVTLHHRIGFVPAGEASLFLRVYSERRKAAFRASEDLVERLKACVPIWKHPVYAAVQVA